jgi:solute carrier family 25 (mitochondrial S-adenosylmethionine transporter), member 26
LLQVLLSHLFQAGGTAGLSVDVALFPIDTVKTRLQSERGFWRSGGFKGIYNGLGPCAAGSIPTAALFFVTYDGLKSYLSQYTESSQAPLVHMVSASFAEVVACIIRVPVEVAKQRRQAFSVKSNITSIGILREAYKTEGIRKGIYRGFKSTIMREIPFSFIQFPLWEYFKANWEVRTNTPLSPVSVSICGAVAGAIAAAITTPLDVAKTRIMLADQNELGKRSVFEVMRNIYRDRGIRGLFAGFVPRVMWITIGGAVFFGFYDLTTRMLDNVDENKS